MCSLIMTQDINLSLFNLLFTSVPCQLLSASELCDSTSSCNFIQNVGPYNLLCDVWETANYSLQCLLFIQAAAEVPTTYPRNTSYCLTIMWEVFLLNIHLSIVFSLMHTYQMQFCSQMLTSHSHLSSWPRT